MLRYLYQSMTRKAAIVPASLALAMVAGQAQAEDIFLANANFDDQDVVPFGGFGPFVSGWTQAGPLGTNGPFVDLPLDTGVFTNVAFGPYPVVSNASVPVGPDFVNQLAFFVVNTDAGQNGDPLVSITQESAAVFEAGKQYTFTLGVGLSVSGQASGVNGDGQAASLVLDVGYFAPAGGDFVSLAETVILTGDLPDPDVLAFDSDPSFDNLKDFSAVTGDPALTDPNALDNEVVVRVTQVGGTSGSFMADSARLSSAVPEPGSLALLGLAGLLVSRRRR